MLSVNRWNPFEELTNLHRQVDQMFGDRWGGALAQPEGEAWAPAADVTSDGDVWRLRLALPGIDPKDVTVDLHGNTLKVAGERKSETTNGSTRSEIVYGRFERIFTLPTDIDADQVQATYRHGMLELSLPVAQSAKPRRIEIGSGRQGMKQAS